MSDPFPLPARRLGGVACAALILLSLTACEHRPARRGNPHEMAPGIPRVSLHATSTFFGGQLFADATVSRGLPARPHDGSGHGERPIKTEFGGMPEDSGEPHRDWRRGGPEAGLVGGIGRFNTSPAITLRVRLENKGQTDLTVTIRDVDSVLGNFVPQPEKVSLKPGQSAELDPMTSRLGVVAATIPLTLSFRIGEKTETQKLVLREPAGAATPAAP